MKIFMVFTVNSKFPFILLFSCFSASGVITDVAKQNRNIMTLTLSAYRKDREKQNLSANKNKMLIPE